MNAMKHASSAVERADDDPSKDPAGPPTMPVPPTPVRVTDVWREFSTQAETVHAVNGVSLEVRAGELVCLYGASGSGKTTLLNLMAGLDVPDRGTVEVAGRAISGQDEQARAEARLRHIAVVFQDDNLIAEFSALENLEIPLLASGLTRQEARDRGRSALADLGIEHLADRRPARMSGGQRQRVGIARALAGGQEIILADEPTGALDQENSRRLFGLMQSLSHDRSLSIVVATHDPLGRDHADAVRTMVDGVLA